MKFLILLVSVLLVFANSSAMGQDSFSPVKGINNISIKQWTAEQGLASNNITSVFQDSQGLIWITSFNGFMVYDGERFEIYDVNSLPLLDTDGFYQAVEGPNGEIYLGSQGSGIIKYYKGIFSRLSCEGDPIPKSIRKLYFTKTGELYIGTNNNGAFVIKDNVCTRIKGNTSLNETTVISIAESGDGQIWLGTEGKGLFKVKGEEIKRITKEDGLSSDVVTSLLVDPSNNLIIGTDNGLQLISESGEFETENQLSGIYINYMMRDDWNSIWMGTENGLVRWNGESDKLDWLLEKKGIDFVRISSVIKDHENNIWITSNRTGLIQIKESLVTNLTKPALSSDRVYMIHESWNGMYYIGSDKNSIDICEGLNCETLSIKKDLKGNGVRDIYHDQDGSIWLATYVGIIHIQNGKETIYSTNTGMPSNNFRTILKDQNGFFWFGTRSGGLVKFKEGHVVKIFSKGNGLKSNFVLAASESSDGNIYVGTHSGGMTIIDTQDRCKTYHVKEDDAGLLIFNIDIEKDGLARITANIGVIHFDGSRLQKIELAPDKRSKTYFDLVNDGTGNLWITTNIGVLNIKTEDWEQFIAGERSEVPHLLVDDNQGMNNKECTGATRSTLNKAGNLMIPTLGGVCIIDPKNLDKKRNIPEVVLRHVMIDNKELNLNDSSVVVLAGALRHKFLFSVLSFSASERNQYSYLLEGFDKEWSDYTYDGQVEYTNLPPGSYTFKVRGCNDAGICNESGDSFQFEVEPYFYETVWFYLLIFLVIVAILFGMYKWRISIINRKNVELKKVNQELDRFVYSASHELRSPLSSILGLINVAKSDPSADKSEYFEFIEKSVQRLDLFIHDIIDYSRNSRQELQRDEIDLEQVVNNVINDLSYLDNFDKVKFEVQNKLVSPFYNDERRLKIVLSNLITNAFKHHAPNEIDNPYVKISFNRTGQLITIAVMDNGPGIEKKHQKNIFKMFYRATTKTEGTGLGLYIVSEIIETMKGKIKMTSDSKNGTKFTLTFPSLD